MTQKVTEGRVTFSSFFPLPIDLNVNFVSKVIYAGWVMNERGWSHYKFFWVQKES